MYDHRGYTPTATDASDGASRTAGSGKAEKGTLCVGAAPASKGRRDGNGTTRNGKHGIRGGNADPGGTFDAVSTPKSAKAFIYNLFFNAEII